jgi:hypothetical protein
MYLDDIESDLSALHRIEPDDVDSLSAHRFFQLAMRLMHYQGAVRGQMESERERAPQHHYDAPNTHTEIPPEPQPVEAKPVRSGTKGSDGKTVYQDIHHNPELSQYFD